ncbi:OB-fold protein [Pseudomonas marginalis]|uniref:OB-fold protein n=1 Tax=Pseudomonas marginalis TaxID=298 RepID=UPI003BA1CBF7
MALIECKECSKQVSDSAVSCPNCGAPVAAVYAAPFAAAQPVTKSVGFGFALGIFFLPWIFSWFLLGRGYSSKARVIGIGWLALSAYLFFAARGTTPPTVSTSSTPSKPVVSQQEARASRIASLSTITTSQLAAAYDRNTVAADQQFKGKQFKVTGIVSSINTDFRGRPYVTMQGGVNQFMEPQFSFEDAKDPAIAQLQKGSKITLACTGNGDIAKTPMSKDCEFVR